MGSKVNPKVLLQPALGFSTRAQFGVRVKEISVRRVFKIKFS